MKISRPEFAAFLELSPDQSNLIDEWLENGLPAERDSAGDLWFDRDEAIDWLVAEDLVEFPSVGRDIVFKTLKEFSAWSGVPYNTVAGTWRSSGFPFDHRGVSVRRAFQWVAEQYGGNRTVAGDDSVAMRKKLAEVRQAEARARRLEMDLNKEESQYMLTDQAQQEVAEAIIFFRESLMRVPPAMRPRLPNEAWADDFIKSLKVELTSTLDVMSKNFHDAVSNAVV